jgi:hypothetical protein
MLIIPATAMLQPRKPLVRLMTTASSTIQPGVVFSTQRLLKLPFVQFPAPLYGLQCTPHRALGTLLTHGLQVLPC